MVADPLAGAFRGDVYDDELGLQQMWLTTVGMVQVNVVPA